jgi:heme-degrading monooxygenase HmoA
MFARVTEITGPSDRIDAGMAQFRDLVVPAIKAMDGFQRAYLLINREGGRALSITTWDTQEAMRASDEAANGLVARIAETLEAQASVTHYELAAEEPSG